MRPPYLKPFWRYYGGKWRAAPHYPKPTHATIVEPFAGAAGYSLRYYGHNVVLVEKYAAVAGIWRFLIRATASEVLSIPTVEHVDDLPGWVPQEANHLVGFALNSASAVPCKQLSSGMRRRGAIKGGQSYGWSVAMRERVATQVEHIRHWKVIEGNYTQAPDVDATWFVDPPYQGHAGSHYKESSLRIDYPSLGD